MEGLLDLSSLRHVGFAVLHLEESVAFYEKMGIGPFRIFKPEYHEKSYRDEKGDFEIKVAIASFGPIEIELIEPLRGATVYDDFLEKTGGGIHHVAFEVRNLDSLLREFRKLGVGVVMSGARKALRFVYLDAKQGNLILELIEKNE